MKLRFKVISILLVLTMAMGLFAGCNKKDNKADDGNNTQNSGNTDTGNNDTGNNDTGKDEEQITLRIVDWSDSAAQWRKEFNEEYMKNNPNIKIEYTMLTIDQFKTSVITSIKSGDAPDLFPVPSGMSLSSAIKEEWYQPMNDYMPEEFWDTLVDGAMAEGITQMNGDIYTIPEVTPITNSLIYYNQDVLDAAGITELPTTYSEFIEVNKKVTEAGKGQFYGFIEGGKQLNRLDILVRAFADVAGGKLAQNSKSLTLNGRANYDSAEVKGVFDLFAQLYKDGSMHPDTVNISAPEAREYFAQGQAAFLMQGNWCVSTWDATYPDMNYGVMAVPSPDGGAKGAIAKEIFAPWMGIYSKSEHPQEAADYLLALYSYTEGYHYQEDLVAEAGQLSIIKGMVEENLTNPHALEYYNIANEVSLDIPVATIRDPKVYDFYAEVVDVQPNLASLFQGVISGGLNDYESALTTLAEDTTAEWKRAAEAVGVDFSVFEFENWDPMKNYTAEDYEALK